MATLQTGQVYDLFNAIATHNNIVYHNDESFGQVGDWFPVKSADGTVTFMSRDPNTCTLDNG